MVPDAVFGLEYLMDGRKTYRFFALEADRGTMPITRSSPARRTSYLQKLLAYGDVIAQQTHKTHLGVPNLFILTVTDSERHGKGLVSAFQSATSGSPIFLFASIAPTHSDASIHCLLQRSWERAGYPPICIALSECPRANDAADQT